MKFTHEPKYEVWNGLKWIYYSVKVFWKVHAQDEIAFWNPECNLKTDLMTKAAN